jgi:hypothetical protein
VTFECLRKPRDPLDVKSRSTYLNRSHILRTVCSECSECWRWSRQLCSSLGKSGRKRRAPKRLRTAEGSSDAAASLYNTVRHNHNNNNNI